MAATPDTLGRLTARRQVPVTPTDRTGLVPVEDEDGRPLALTFVPEPADGRPYRLALLLHGAGGAPRQALDLLFASATEQRLLLAAPRSVAASWDLVHTGLGPDVRRIDRLLTGLLGAYPVADVLIGGFSDGASYALSLGLANGDLFDGVLAFSPGFAAPPVTQGRPRIFVSHGTADRVLPIERCSRRVVPRLTAMGYDVTYHEFRGGHEVPDDVVGRALTWWAA